MTAHPTKTISGFARGESKQCGWFDRSLRFFLFLLEGIMAMMTMVIAAPRIRTNEHADNYKWPDISERRHL